MDVASCDGIHAAPDTSPCSYGSAKEGRITYFICGHFNFQSYLDILLHIKRNLATLKEGGGCADF